MSKVIAGPAGHFYALLDDPQFGETLMGHPIDAEGGTHDESNPPAHPAESGEFDGWYEITDPAPECDDAAIIAELKA
jgi:hypothetical protein